MVTPIYALCDYQTLVKFDISLEQYLAICHNHNVVYIQYRDKINSIQTQKENILYLKENTIIPIIVNDNIDLLQYCDGIHLGQEDLARFSDSYKLKPRYFIKQLRKKYPDKIIGISTHNELEILETNSYDIDYIGLGAYRETQTKDVSKVLGDTISYLAKISTHNVGIIGAVQIEDKVKYVSYNVIGSGLLKS